MKCKALIKVFNGGKYGKMGEYIAIIEPEFFKNGDLKITKFKVIEKLETIKEGYKFGNAKSMEGIAKIIEVIER